MSPSKEQDENSEQSQTIIFPGFSDRLNLLIDRSHVDFASIGEGRAAAFERLFNSSKGTAFRCLRKNIPPRPTLLRKITEYFFHRSKLQHITVEQVEAWLKYGPDIVGDPFSAPDPFEDNNILLCCNLISEVADTLHLSASQYDLKKVVRLTVATLRSYSISSATEVEAGVMLLIRKHIEDSMR